MKVKIVDQYLYDVIYDIVYKKGYVSFTDFPICHTRVFVYRDPSPYVTFVLFTKGNV